MLPSSSLSVSASPKVTSFQCGRKGSLSPEFYLLFPRSSLFGRRRSFFCLSCFSFPLPLLFSSIEVHDGSEGTSIFPKLGLPWPLPPPPPPRPLSSSSKKNTFAQRGGREAPFLLFFCTLIRGTFAPRSVPRSPPRPRRPLSSRPVAISNISIFHFPGCPTPSPSPRRPFPFVCTRSNDPDKRRRPSQREGRNPLVVNTGKSLVGSSSFGVFSSQSRSASI